MVQTAMVLEIVHLCVRTCETAGEYVVKTVLVGYHAYHWLIYEFVVADQAATGTCMTPHWSCPHFLLELILLD